MAGISFRNTATAALPYEHFYRKIRKQGSSAAGVMNIGLTAKIIRRFRRRIRLTALPAGGGLRFRRPLKPTA